MEELNQMSATQVAGREPEVNAKGFLVNFDDWNRAVAESIAEKEGLRLTDCHWTVINFLREYYSELETPPSPRIVIKGIGEQLTTNAPCTRRTLEGLFPAGGCKQACRVAGLPDYYCHSC
jgi:tRNA 2-thiouridine synthesizing protein E